VWYFDEHRSFSFLEKANILEPGARLPTYQEIKKFTKRLKKN